MQNIDARNAEFWEELCGTGLAQSIGITGEEDRDLERFDRAYLDLYPYLPPYVHRLGPSDKAVLEIGLGYGTLGTYLLKAGANYSGLDIADGPVRMMRHRASLAGKPDAPVLQGSALELPWPDHTFDAVVSIGCLHHTGDLPSSVDEVHRVLRPGGLALVMLYNRHSFRQLVQAPLVRLREQRTGAAERLRGMYDTNRAGAAAPHTDYVSKRDVRRLFHAFSELDIETRNFDTLIWPGGLLIPRARLLNNIGRIVGLDLYIIARK